jgi:RHS repeat-associated protein
VAADYLTGLGLDQPFVRTAGGSTAYYLSDALGSIVGLAGPTGAVPTTYTYEPYGTTTVAGTASASPLGFTGRENDSTGTLSLYNYRARAYSPTLHRFLTEDPVGFAGSDFNLFRYTANEPTNITDPLGWESAGGCGGFAAAMTCFVESNPWVSFGVILALDSIAVGASFWALAAVGFTPIFVAAAIASIAGWASFVVTASSGTGSATVGALLVANAVSTGIALPFVLGLTNPTALAIILAIDVAIFLFDTTTGGVALADE